MLKITLIGRDRLYELLGAVWLSEGEEYRERLVKEALKRGSSEERQRYNQLQQRKTVIIQRLAELAALQDALNFNDNQNILPEKPSSSCAPDKTPTKLGLPRPSPPSKREEAALDAKQHQYIAQLQAYRIQNSSMLSERLRLMGEYLALQSEFSSLEECEKWILLSMAIKNQSSLIGYMRVSDEK